MLQYRFSSINKKQNNLSDKVSEQPVQLQHSVDAQEQHKEDQELVCNTPKENSDVLYDDDDRYYWFDDEPTITMSEDTDIAESSSPLYQNQEGDPKVQDMIFQQEMQEYDN